jgi:hypothetical protein
MTIDLHARSIHYFRTEESTSIAGVGAIYQIENDSFDLLVRFKNGTSYVYPGVAQALVELMLDVAKGAVDGDGNRISVGKLFAAEVRSKYAGRKIQEPIPELDGLDTVEPMPGNPEE